MQRYSEFRMTYHPSINPPHHSLKTPLHPYPTGENPVGVHLITIYQMYLMQEVLVLEISEGILDWLVFSLNFHSANADIHVWKSNS